MGDISERWLASGQDQFMEEMTFHSTRFRFRCSLSGIT